MRYARFALALCAGGCLLALSGCERPPFAGPAAAPEIRPGEPVFAIPAGPRHDAAGYQLILDFEVGGGRPYYDARLARPTWPGFASGVTWGIGYDGGYNSRSVILTDWHRVPYGDRERLADVSGITGKAAKPLAAGLRDIVVAWPHAEEVFQRVTIGRFWAQTRRAFPGVEKLPPSAQWALLSLVYNRGPGMSGARRAEMREIRAAVARGDLRAAAEANRRSIRLWRGTEIERGMRRRRNAESELLEKGLTQRVGRVERSWGEFPSDSSRPLRDVIVWTRPERRWTVYPVVTATANEAALYGYDFTAELRGIYRF